MAPDAMPPDTAPPVRPSWTARPEVVAARARMIRSAQAWNAVSPGEDSDGPLDPNQELLFREALFAQRLYQDAKAAARSGSA